MVNWMIVVNWMAVVVGFGGKDLKDVVGTTASEQITKNNFFSFQEWYTLCVVPQIGIRFR